MFPMVVTACLCGYACLVQIPTAVPVNCAYDAPYMACTQRDCAVITQIFMGMSVVISVASHSDTLLCVAAKNAYLTAVFDSVFDRETLMDVTGTPSL